MTGAVTAVPEKAPAKDFVSDAEVIERIKASGDAESWFRLFEAGEPYRNQLNTSTDIDLAQIIVRHTDNDAQACGLFLDSKWVALWPPEVRRAREGFGGEKSKNRVVGLMGYALALMETARASVGGGSQGSGPGPADLPTVITLAEFKKNPDFLKPPRPMIPRLAWPGHVTLLASPEGSGKSTLLRAACAAVTTGQAFLGGEPNPPGVVLWANLEESLATCMNGALRFSAEPESFVAWLPGSDPVGELCDEVRSRKPAAVVVDSIQELAIKAGVENLDDAVQVGKALGAVVAVCRETQTAMVWLSQASKATGKYRNSSWFGHAVDVSLDIAEYSEGSSERRVRVKKTRIEGLRTYTVELAEGGFRLVLGRTGTGADAGKLPREQAKVLTALQPGMTFGAWLAAYGGNRNTFKSAVTGRKGLRERGLVTQDEETAIWSPVQFNVEQELHAA